MEPETKREYKYDFLPLTLSLETSRGILVPLIRRGTPLPTKRSQVCSTVADKQKSAGIKVLLGERPLSKDNILLGKCQLNGIAPAKRGVPQICVTFEVDTSCYIKVEASDMKSRKQIKAKFEKAPTELTPELAQKQLLDAQANKQRDEARLTIAEAESRVQNDRTENRETQTTQKIEGLISSLGIALMNDNSAEIIPKNRELRDLIEKSKPGTYAFGSGGFDNIFEPFFSTTSYVSKKKKPITKRPVSPPQKQKKEDVTPVSTPSTYITALIQNFLEQVAPNLESKRAGAWQALESGTQDGPAQAAYSMREVLSQLLDNIALESEVRQAPWYIKPNSGAPVTRAMRIRYSITGTADIESESTLSLINGMAEAVNSMYAKLSAESHGEKRPRISAVRMYLNACEALIGLIATERRT